MIDVSKRPAGLAQVLAIGSGAAVLAASLVALALAVIALIVAIL